MDYKEGPTEYDIRGDRLRTIGALSQEVTLAYRNVLAKTTPKSLESYYISLKVLYRDIKRYADPDKVEKSENGEEKSKIERIEGLMDEMENRLENDSTEIYTETSGMLEKLEKLDDLIQGVRMDVGLDIPREKRYDPEDAGLAGLEG